MIEIGSKDWVARLRESSTARGKDLWADFQVANAEDIAELESRIERRLPADFVEFYRCIGYGSFPEVGGFHSPEEINMMIGAPIYFVLGSMFQGEEWATEEEHRRLWISRGQENPGPARFTSDRLKLGNILLYDLLQFGWDGEGNYDQLHLGGGTHTVAYCLLTDSQTIEKEAATLSEAIDRIVSDFLAWGEEYE